MHVMRVRTWFGADAVIEIQPGGMHRAGFGRWLIPHPPVINWLLRCGLLDTARYRLSVAHELGHLQAFPLELTYAMVLFGIAIERGHSGWDVLILVLLSCFAAWEIAAEIYALRCEGPFYRMQYRCISLFPRVLFWTAMVSLALSGWIVALR
jgi:hypothetical protein